MRVQKVQLRKVRLATFGQWLQLGQQLTILFMNHNWERRRSIVEANLAAD